MDLSLNNHWGGGGGGGGWGGGGGAIKQPLNLRSCETISSDFRRQKYVTDPKFAILILNKPVFKQILRHL